VKQGTRQFAFKADEITYLDRKTIHLDRAMLKLFELLRADGRPLARVRRATITVDELVKLVMTSPQRFPGFEDRETIAAAWLRSDLLQVMHRGKGERETVVGPRPLHLNAFKLANAKAVQDYGASDQVWALLYHADRDLLTRLKEFFSPALDPMRDEYDGTTELDLETHAVLNLVDATGIRVSPRTGPTPTPMRPLCLGQGRLLAEDLRCLLAYRDAVPRQVLAGYMRTVIGLHLALFMVRLLRLVPAQVEAALEGRLAPRCLAEVHGEPRCFDCPFAGELAVDLSDDSGSGPGRLARASAAAVLDGLPRYVRAVFVVNQLKDFAGLHDRMRGTAGRRSVDELLQLVREPPPDMDGFFEGQILELLRLEDPDEERSQTVELILREELPSLQKLVELICGKRLPIERQALVRLIDSLTQKNRPGGFLRQTAGQGAPRWFALDSHLLETLAQIAVVDRGSDGYLRTRVVLLDYFIDWLRTRYGFVVYAPSHRRAVPPDEYAAWQENERQFRRRLHEIGFFTDLSDAYNSQTLRPRYQVEHA
jgi:hypothetical protein